MKKLILIVAVLFSINAYGQLRDHLGSVDANDITASDTVFYFGNTGGAFSVEIYDYHVSSDSVDVYIGAANSDSTFHAWDNTGNPYECGTDSTQVQGSYVGGKAFYRDNNPFMYNCVKVDPTGTTAAADSVIFRIVQVRE